MKTQNNQYKTRAHRILFDRDLPFKPKRVEMKTLYKRRPKHKDREYGIV
jgi:nitrogen fixation-related uncharacterized protein